MSGNPLAVMAVIVAVAGLVTGCVTRALAGRRLDPLMLAIITMAAVLNVIADASRHQWAGVWTGTAFIVLGLGVLAWDGI